MRRPVLRIALAVVVAAGIAGGCARRSPQSKAKSARVNVLLLVVDALRPDHLGAYGYRRDTSPTIDRLASEGFVFEQARAAANFTRASVPSLLAGAYPGVHGVFDKEDRLADGFRTLAEILHDRGWATAAFVPNPNLRREVNMGQGFDLWDDGPGVSEGSALNWLTIETTRRIQSHALDFLDAHPDRPFFLYLHYLEVHGPYSPPSPYDRRYWDPEAAARNPRRRRISGRERRSLPGYLRSENDRGLLDYYVAQYDGEIRYTDDRLAEFLAELDRRGVLDDTLVVVTADHGEAFLEHKQWEHGGGLYEEELRVPLIFRLPGAPRAATRVAAPANGVDVMPTVLDLLGVDERPAHLQGRSLRPLLEGATLPDEPGFAQGSRNRFAVWWQGHKLQRRATARRPWALWNLASDPREKHNLATTQRAIFDRLYARIEDFQRANLRLGQHYPAEHLTVDEETERALRSLGYN